MERGRHGEAWTLNQIEPPRFPIQGSVLSPQALSIICFSGSPTKLSSRVLAKHQSSPFGRKSSPIGSRFYSIDRKSSPLGRKSSPIGRKSSMAEGKESCSKQARGLWLPPLLLLPDPGEVCDISRISEALFLVSRLGHWTSSFISSKLQIWTNLAGFLT